MLSSTSLRSDEAVRGASDCTWASEGMKTVVSMAIMLYDSNILMRFPLTSNLI